VLVQVLVLVLVHVSELRNRLRGCPIPAGMFDHEKLDVYNARSSTSRSS